MNLTKSSLNLKRHRSAVHRNRQSPVRGWNTRTNRKRDPRESRTLRIDSIGSGDSKGYNPVSVAIAPADRISFLARGLSEIGVHTGAVLAAMAAMAAAWAVSVVDTAVGSAAMAVVTVTAASAAARAAATSAATAAA